MRRNKQVSQPRSSQSAITTFWDTVAPHYESHPGNTALPGSESHRRWIELFEQRLPDPPTDVLDVCTGTGFAALICAELGHRVTGIDLAPHMLQIARQMAEEREIQAEFIEADAVAPPFDEASFDVIACRYALWTLTGADQALRSWHRLLRPGGRLVIVDGLRKWDEQVEEEELFSEHYTPEVQSSLPFMRLENGDALLRELADADFHDAQFELLPEVFLESDDNYLGYVIVAYR